jgi:hypothetical protein
MESSENSQTARTSTRTAAYHEHIYVYIYDISSGSVVWIPIEFEHVGQSMGAHSTSEITCDGFFLMTAVT